MAVEQNGKKLGNVFISYSHKDEQWKDRLISHLHVLEQQGLLQMWDDRKINTGADWYNEIQVAMAHTPVTVCLISADYLASDFVAKEEIPYLLRRRTEEGMALIPVLLRPCYWEVVRWLAPIQMFPRDGKIVSEDFRGREDVVFADVAREVHRALNSPGYRPVRAASAWKPAEMVDIDCLRYTDARLFGREKELQLLDELWDCRSANVVSLVAWGGVGKSTLVNQWLEYLKAENYRGAKRVYGWSFYSQGTGTRVTSADQFITQALTWFGDPDPMRGSPWDRGERLVALIRRQKTLLVLDGLEPLQSGSDLDIGRISDPALSLLVTQLANQNNGLCVITTREKIAELARQKATAPQVDLEQISSDAGRALLRVGRVRGTDKELEKASAMFGNHALAISLLAAYLRDIDGHHISNVALIPDLDIPSARGRHARRVMDAFDTRFDHDARAQVLRIMGLFNYPPDLATIDAVKRTPPIPSLTDKLVNLSDNEWHDLVDALRACGLLAPKSSHSPDVIDCHPLVREHFARKLQNTQLGARQEAHKRIYEHLAENTKRWPNTLAELQPLFQAVAHGCRAGLHREAFVDIYVGRINRGERFSITKLAAPRATLDVLRNFFEQPWIRPMSGVLMGKVVRRHEEAWLLDEAARCLRALGQLREAIEPSRRALTLHTASWHWRSAIMSAINLSEMEVIRGHIDRAQRYAHKAMKWARENDPHPGSELSSRERIADCLYQAGDYGLARELFCEAEAVRHELSERWHTPLSLYSRFPHHDLLMAETERIAWQITMGQPMGDGHCGIRSELLQCCSRSEHGVAETLTRLKNEENVLGIALDHLTLARAALYRAVLSGTIHYCTRSIRDAAARVQEALASLRGGTRLDELPKGLLTRAWLRGLNGETAGAQEDLDEARQIAERGSMRLHMTDIHLYRARLFGPRQAETKYPWESPQADLAEARRLIEECGYHRRDAELADAEEAAKNWGNWRK